MNPWRVLLVDDHDGFLDRVEEIMASYPEFRVVGRAHSGQEAVGLCSQTAPDAVLMDVSMPGMNGFEATRQIKTAAKPPVVVILTLHAGEDYELAAREAGAEGFLSKTEFAQHLPGLLRRLLASRARGQSTPPAQE